MYINIIIQTLAFCRGFYVIRHSKSKAALLLNIFYITLLEKKGE